MVSKSKLYNKLDILETELKERLVPHLEEAANGNNAAIMGQAIGELNQGPAALRGPR